MQTAIVVGSGAGGATVAKELQGAFDVTVLEAGVRTAAPSSSGARSTGSRGASSSSTPG